MDPPTLLTVTRALEVLTAFLDAEELGVSSLSRRLGAPKSAVHRIVRTLAAQGFLAQSPNRRYRLGMRVLELGQACRLRTSLVQLAAPVLRELSRRAGANAHLAKLDRGEVVDIARDEYPAPLRVRKSPLLRRPAHATALGKALLAYGGAEALRQTLDNGLARLTPRTITRPDRLLAELERVRRRGYAVDNQEFDLGQRCVAAPVFDESGEAAAAISVSALITHLTEDRVPQFAAWVMEAARTLSAQLGHRAAAREA